MQQRAPLAAHSASLSCSLARGNLVSSFFHSRQAARYIGYSFTPALALFSSTFCLGTISLSPLLFVSPKFFFDFPTHDCAPICSALSLDDDFLVYLSHAPAGSCFVLFFIWLLFELWSFGMSSMRMRILLMRCFSPLIHSFLFLGSSRWSNRCYRNNEVGLWRPARPQTASGKQYSL